MKNGKGKILGVTSAILLVVLFSIFQTSFPLITLPEEGDASARVTITELEDMLDEIDPYIQLRNGNKLILTRGKLVINK